MVTAVLVGGGTAGHTSPLIATAMALQNRGATVSCIGTPKGLEGRVIPEAGLDLDMIPPVPLPRTVSAELFKVPARLAGAVRKAGDVLKRRQADVVVGFGGYVSLPAYLAAKRAKIPVVIHEQNAVPGLANKVAARFAVFVGTAFPDTPLPKAQFVGMPLRPHITDLADASSQVRAERRARARADFGLDTDRATLLVSGGSQGAVAINDAVIAARQRLLADGVQILHVLGPKNIRGAEAVNDESTGASWLPVGYVDDMASAYAAADLMVARSGAGTVVETATVGVPTIYVPLPHGNGEQARNATSVVAAGAGVVVANADLDAERLLHETARIHNPDVLSRMSAAGRGLMPAHAAEEMAARVISAATSIDPTIG
ncbi:undecaprenyldiphospho-muramoylpentapeptide beta-N-acetylglucosaminyltransferase [Cutibacterium sp. WCA-380-WT-3A]|uniref:UDP-N-acetylglucosamine--N-acetylmuramyl-(pentapeptide) pyrophosphoryl-undecaprenol N-acetylglucosamine transferase n=1 Tax=Cutibacterium porci TaxID=2605781 RepID=A0A7K0J7W0_9ACTN|nr:undecaprenyldiphospho-muramoylpentapeptide beta-N-acetylglucosaminyltransferase [Cutibacterium porci]MSS45828.1 undecaprenyldiphospho-muramoylpentapeptide beta-N-acetylglucosaminyltransferase [Cutibacterium porci]